MAYVLSGVVAAMPVAWQVARALAAGFVELGQGFALIPLAGIHPDDVVAPAGTSGWGELQRIVDATGEPSAAGPVAFVAADFFGGTGDQAAVVWHRGSVVLSPSSQRVDSATPITAESPINLALRRLGARRHGELDEFDSIGLGRHRHVEDWAVRWPVSAPPPPG